MTIFIGIEGGATKSSGVLVDGKSGEILKEITGGPANVWVRFGREIREMKNFVIRGKASLRDLMLRLAQLIDHFIFRG